MPPAGMAPLADPLPEAWPDQPVPFPAGGAEILCIGTELLLGQPQFGGDHMHDPLAATAQTMQGDAGVGAMALERLEHRFGQGVGERPRLGGGGHDVIHRGHGALGMAHGQAQVAQAGEGLGGGHLMDEMQTDEQLGGATRKLGDPVQIPDLVVKGAGAQERSPIWKTA